MAPKPRCVPQLSGLLRPRGLERTILPLSCSPRLLHTINATPVSGTITPETSILFAPSRTNYNYAGLIRANQVANPIESMDTMVEILSSSFVGDPIYTWFLSDYPVSQHKALLALLFRAFLTQATLNRGDFIEAGDFGSCGLIMPPGSDLDNPWTMLQAGLIPALWTMGLGAFRVCLQRFFFRFSPPSHFCFMSETQLTNILSLKRAVFELAGGTKPIMDRAFTREERANHWYGAFMGTAEAHRKRGLGTSMFVYMMERSKGDGRPMSFEAATPFNRDLYLKHGGRVVGEFVVGKGRVGVDGLPKKNGEGITVWPMIWRP